MSIGCTNCKDLLQVLEKVPGFPFSGVVLLSPEHVYPIQHQGSGANLKSSGFSDAVSVFTDSSAACGGLADSNL